MTQASRAAAALRHDCEQPSVRVQHVCQSRLDQLELASVPFGSVPSDHMFLVEHKGGVWTDPAIVPYQTLAIQPTISALHYGVSAFEGLKACRSLDGRPLLFRPWNNVRRLNRTAERLVMPQIPEPLFLDGLRTLVRLDQRWIPSTDAGSLYLRPVLFSADESLRVKPAERFYLAILAFPFGSYFAAPVSVRVVERYARAFSGGTGDIKAAGNYAAALLADKEARDAGYDTVMWLDAEERRYIEECGVMNVFFVLDDRVVTPALSGTILPGITRDSVITLLKDSGTTVEERRISIDEVVGLHGQGRLRECFGTGTAVTVSQVQRIRYRDAELILPPAGTECVGAAVRDHLVRIATGRAPDPHSWVDRL